MLSYYRLEDDKWVQSAKEQASWVRAVNPGEDELEQITNEYGITADDLKSGLDDLELPRLEHAEGYSMIYISTSRMAEDASWRVATLGVAMMSDAMLTVSAHETELVEDFLARNLKCVGECSVKDAVLGLLLRSTEMCLRDLRLIDRKNAELEKKLGFAMKNSLIFSFLSLEKSLVYLRTAVNGNQSALEKLLSSDWLKNDARRQEALDDIIIENRQACDMAGIYTDIMSNTMDAFASIINNNLNVVMKFLTSVAIVLAVPTIVFAIFSMNIPVPWAGNPRAYIVAIVMALTLTVLAVLVMVKKKLF